MTNFVPGARLNVNVGLTQIVALTAAPTEVLFVLSAVTLPLMASAVSPVGQPEPPE